MQRTNIKLLLLLIPLLISACAVSTESTVSKSTGLTFIHLNDTYRVADVEDGTRGGFGRAITVIRRAQSEGRDVRVLHGGDLLSPSLESQIWFGGQMVRALNFIDDIAPTYFVAGNHEFDIGDDDLAFFINAVRSSRFDWLGDNYVLKTDDEVADRALKSAFTMTHGDKTIGVFAITLHPLDGGTARSYVDYNRNYIATARRVIQQLEAQGVDMIIGLTHLHMATDEAIAKLRAEYPKLEFIVGGHEHEVASHMQSNGSAAIFKGSSNARVIWRIDVDFATDGDVSINAASLDMDADAAKDPDYQKLEDEWHAQLLRLYPIIDAKVGEAGIRFDVTEESVRNEESSWGNFVVDLARSAYGKPKSDLAFINSGSLRIDDYIAGEITYEDIARTFGFPSQLRRVTVSGAEFVAMLEAGYRGEGRSKGYFPQVSGFRVCVDRRKPDYARIVSLQLDKAGAFEAIDPGESYSLILPDYLFGDKDGYTMPKSAKESASLPGPELKYLVVDAIIKAQFRSTPVGAEIDPANPRFVELSAARENCWQ